MALTLASLSGCGETTALDQGGVDITVQTTGGDLDLTGYDLLLDGKRVRTLRVNANAILDALTPGTHTVALDGLAANCTVSDPNPRQVLILAGVRSAITFSVECVPTGVIVTTHTTGYAPPEFHTVVVGGRSPMSVAANTSTPVSRLEPGTYAVVLVITGTHCTVDGMNPVTVTVTPLTMTPVPFEVSCTVPVRQPKIAFEVYLPASWIATVNPDGTGMALVDLGYSPTWSPDQRYLLWSTSWCDFFYYFACGGGMTVRDLETGETTNLAIRAFEPAWSPQGDAVAFTQWEAPLTPVNQLYVASVPGWVTGTFEFEGITEIHSATWSPDGTRIAFQCYRPPDWDICAARSSDGSELTFLTADHLPRANLAWSPDGTRIAFTSHDGGLNRVGILAVTTGAITDLGEGSHPAWSPDGSQLVFVGDNGLFTMNADGTNRQRLTTGSHYAPAWRP